MLTSSAWSSIIILKSVSLVEYFQTICRGVLTLDCAIHNEPAPQTTHQAL